MRLAAVLAAGFRLTVPPPHSTPPKEVALVYPKGNAFFQTAIRYGDRPDEKVELDKLGRVGSYTTAEMWKAITPSAEQKSLFDLLSGGLKDPSEVVRLQAAYFLSLLRNPRTEPAVARVFAEVRERRLADVPVRTSVKAWAVGPFAADDPGRSRAPSISPRNTRPRWARRPGAKWRARMASSPCRRPRGRGHPATIPVLSPPELGAQTVAAARPAPTSATRSGSTAGRWTGDGAEMRWTCSRGATTC